MKYCFFFCIAFLWACTPEPESSDYRLPFEGSFEFTSQACPISETGDTCQALYLFQGKIKLLSFNRLQIKFRDGVASPYSQWSPFIDSLAQLRFPDASPADTSTEVWIEGRFIGTDSLYMTGHLVHLQPNFLWEVRGRRSEK